MASHPFILAFYGITAFFNRLFFLFHKKVMEKNYENNKNASIALTDGFIEDQDRSSGLKYGRVSFSRSGCGTAAVFNAFVSLGLPVPLPDIIRYFEKYGASLFAFFGTSPRSAKRFFERAGFKTRSTASRRKFRELAEDSDVFLFTILNNKEKITDMLHTLCVETKRTEADPVSSGNSPVSPGDRPPVSFIVHNSHGTAEIYGSFEEMMCSLGRRDGRASGVYMVGINKPDY